jgi:hypothetical protein
MCHKTLNFVTAKIKPNQPKPWLLVAQSMVNFKRWAANGLTGAVARLEDCATLVEAHRSVLAPRALQEGLRLRLNPSDFPEN